MIRQAIRAKLGQPADDDPFFGLIKVKDQRQLARLSEFDFYGHSVMDLAATKYEELEMWGKIAKTEDVYSITIEGEQRKEAILMQRAKVEQTTPLTVQMPQVELKPQEPEKKEKKGWFK